MQEPGHPDFLMEIQQNLTVVNMTGLFHALSPGPVNIGGSVNKRLIVFVCGIAWFCVVVCWFCI